MDSPDLSKEDTDKCLYVMKQLEYILTADQNDREEQAKKALQEMENYKRQLKETMKNKIKKTKEMLRDLNGKDADISSRLTLLQNQQLVTELEYQTKHAERLLSINGKLEEQVAELKREIEIHKQVETELARQSKAYQNKAHGFTERFKSYTKNTCREKPQVIEERKTKPKSENDELIIFLEDKLDEAEKKFINFQNDYEALRSEYLKQQKILEKTKDKYNKAGILLVEFLDNILNSTPNILQDQNNLYLDIEKLYFIL